MGSSGTTRRDQWKILPIADFHYIEATDETDLDQDYQRLTGDEALCRTSAAKLALLGNLVPTINALDLDAIVFLGDNMARWSRAGIASIKKAISEISAPVVGVQGNHDLRYKGFGDMWDLDCREALSRELFGHSRYHAIDIGAHRLVLLDNCVRDATTYPTGSEMIDEAQFEFLERELAKGGSTLVAMHTPLYLPNTSAERLRVRYLGPGGAAPDAGEARALSMHQSTQGRLLDLVEKYPNWFGAIAGHYHVYAIDLVGNWTQLSFPIWPEENNALHCIGYHDFKASDPQNPRFARRFWF